METRSLARWVRRGALAAAASAIVAGAPGFAGAQTPTTGAKAFWVESGGGALGSAAGITLAVAVASMTQCDPEDLACAFGKVGLAGATSIAGTTIGARTAGLRSDTSPSTGGALLGAVVGTAFGATLHHLVTEEMGIRVGRPGTAVILAVSQGLAAGAGSRIAVRLRD